MLFRQDTENGIICPYMHHIYKKFLVLTVFRADIYCRRLFIKEPYAANGFFILSYWCYISSLSEYDPTYRTSIKFYINVLIFTNFQNSSTFLQTKNC